MRKETARRRESIQAIRRFNRYYTNRLGLLSRYRFNTRLTLTEARVVYEVGRRSGHTQTALSSDLKIDMGYLSRVVKRLAALGLLKTRKDDRDGRVLLLRLTPAGRRTLAEIDSRSDLQVEGFVEGLSDAEIGRLVGHFKAAEAILEKRAAKTPLIRPAATPAEIRTARTLISEYADFLGADLSFQGFEEEVSRLPGKYAPPSGALFIAYVPSSTSAREPAGCVAVRPLEKGFCEMKRLFVRPAYRGLGIGRLLAETAVREARRIGYRRMRLDTLDRLESAVALYRCLGFKPIPPYCPNPLPGAMFWEKTLRRAPKSRA